MPKYRDWPGLTPEQQGRVLEELDKRIRWTEHRIVELTNRILEPNQNEDRQGHSRSCSERVLR